MLAFALLFIALAAFFITFATVTGTRKIAAQGAAETAEAIRCDAAAQDIENRVHYSWML